MQGSVDPPVTTIGAKVLYYIWNRPQSHCSAAPLFTWSLTGSDGLWGGEISVSLKTPEPYRILRGKFPIEVYDAVIRILDIGCFF